MEHGHGRQRRHVVTSVGGLLLAATLLGVPMSGQAQEVYPSRPIRITVGFPAGSSTDVATRVMANSLGQILNQTVVVENKPGASSDIAARGVASAAPDGYNLFVATIANAINTSSKSVSFINITKAFEPVAMMGSVPNVLVAHPSQQLKSVQDLIKVAKARPGSITFASSGNGTSPHLAGELFARSANVQMLHVPYRGSSPAVADLLAGQVAIMFAPASTVLPHIQAGKLVPLGVASATRTATLPDVPTIAEEGLKGFDSSVWFGLVTPVGTPAAIKTKLAAAVQTAASSSQVKAQFQSQGIDVVSAGPEKFGNYMQSEVDKYAEIMQAAGIKLE